jgi:hypothetical protein
MGLNTTGSLVLGLRPLRFGRFITLKMPRPTGRSGFFFKCLAGRFQQGRYHGIGRRLGHSRFARRLGDLALSIFSFYDPSAIFPRACARDQPGFFQLADINFNNASRDAK